MERLDEMAYSITIMNFPSYSELLNRKDKEYSISFMQKEFKKTKENYGIETLTELIKFELTLPRPKKMYSQLSNEEKNDFWLKVKFVEKLL